MQQAKFVLFWNIKKILLMYKIYLEISISNDKFNKFVEKWNPFQNLINSITCSS